MKNIYKLLYVFLLVMFLPCAFLSGLTFEPESISFGRLKKGESAVRTITIYNTNSLPVVLNRIYGDCSCITYEISEKVIPAYGETWIVLKFNSTDEPVGVFSKTVFIIYAGGEKKIIAEGEVVVSDTTSPVKLNIESKSSSLSNGDASDSSADASAEAVTPVSHVYPVYIAYFYTPGCGDCAMAKKIIRNTSKNFPDIIVKEYDILLRDNRVLLEGLADVYCLAENDSIAPPVVFISCSSGKKYLQGRDISVPALEKIAVNCNKENIVGFRGIQHSVNCIDRRSANGAWRKTCLLISVIGRWVGQVTMQDPFQSKIAHGIFHSRISFQLHALFNAVHVNAGDAALVIRLIGFFFHNACHSIYFCRL